MTTNTKLDQAIESINELCESQLEYETRHGDAGNNYAHMPAENWTEQDTQDFIEQLRRENFDSAEYVQGLGWVNYKPQWQVLGIDPRWQTISPNLLAHMALESYAMSAGSMYGCFEDGITLAEYAVQEIEIDLECLGLDAMTLDLVRESCDAYISGCDRAYVTTDACWFAVVDIEALNIEIEQYIDSMES